MQANITATPNTESIQRPSAVRVMIALEGAALLIGAVALYAHTVGDWGAFALLFFVPDLAFIPYMINARLGTWVYNLLHTITAPVLLGLIALAMSWSAGVGLALIWLAHIGMDRTLGYGLKYPSAFKDTHLQRL